MSSNGFKFMQHVRVKSGFYEGFGGRVIAKQEEIHGYGDVFPATYTVKLDTDTDRLAVDVFVEEDNLEAFNG